VQQEFILLTNVWKPIINLIEKARGIATSTNLQEEMKMNKTEMIAAIADKAELTKKDAEKALKAFTDTVAEELAKGEKVQLVGFGTFEVSERAARVGINPHTREPLNIEASKAPKFKAGKALKDAIN
jgi:DNA-binding protein HU-beta